jgi:hypothetical protein
LGVLCFGNKCTCIYCVLYCLYRVVCIVSFTYIYSYLFCLYEGKDYCHRVTTELQQKKKKIIMLRCVDWNIVTDPPKDSFKSNFGVIDLHMKALRYS